MKQVLSAVFLLYHRANYAVNRSYLPEKYDKRKKVNKIG